LKKKQMKDFLKITLILAASVTVAMTSFGQDSRVNALNEYLNGPAKGCLNGNLLLAIKGNVIYSGSFGYADFPGKIMNQKTSAFNLASISKVFTSTAILQLCEKGQLRLEDNFKNYFPEFPYSNIRISHLLSHTSGLPDLELYEDIVKKNRDTIITNKDIIPALRLWKKPTYFIPGDQWQYCNSGYELLALLVEKISQLSFSDYLDKNIFRPAGMHRTYLQRSLAVVKGNPIPVTMHVLPAWYSDEYVSAQDVPRFRYTNYNLSSTYGASNIVTTTEDLLKFDQAFFGYKFLKKSTVEIALTPVKLNNGEAFQEDHMDTMLGEGTGSYGLGWRIFWIKGMEKAVGHGGFKLGLATFYFRTLSSGQTIIAYDNTAGSEFGKIITSCFRLMNGQKAIDETRRTSLARTYGVTLMKDGPDAAAVKLNELKLNTEKYYLSEQELNWLGYDCLYGDFESHVALALEVFKINTLLFPASFNVYDSYAEALWRAGKTELAIAMYKKSLELNPQNRGGEEALRQLFQNKNK
jgi:CubicO group peptidase (beta-lactamase class C family)